jgi:hypothetical protein
MSASLRPRGIAGWVILGLVATAMILAASLGIFSSPPQEIKESMPGIYEYSKLIALVQLVSALLMLIPLTSSLGILLVSAFWGGAICIHVAHKEAQFLIPAVLLALTWIGAYLRDPVVLASFWGGRKSENNSTP